MPSGTVRLAWWASCLLLLLCAPPSAPAARTEGGAPSFCFWTQALEDGRTHQAFLRQRRGQLELYHAVWGHDGHLRACASSRDAAVTRGYLGECQEDRRQLFGTSPQRRFDTRALLQPGACVEAGAVASAPVRHARDLQTQHAHTEGSGRRRVKRGLMMIPGTLWCGSGNRAANFTDLGPFAQTDQCCREHDHCKHTIASFGSGYGVFNSHIFTLSHCSCDNRFKQCLQKAEDSMASVVGYGYFNLLKMRCFKWSFRMECKQRTWWGRCLSSDLTRYADVQEPTDFNSTLPDNPNLPDQTSTPDLNQACSPDQTAKLGPEQSPELHLSTIVTTPTQSFMSTTDPPNTRNNASNTRTNVSDTRTTLSDTRTDDSDARINFPNKRTDALDTRTNHSDSRTNLPEIRADTANNRTDIRDHSTSLLSTTSSSADSNSSLILLPTATEPTPSGPHLCSVYKFLDDCRLQVPPLQKLFGLKNTELRTLYHCNCTKRLAERLVVLEAAGLHTLLLNFVSESCFILPHTQNTVAPHSSAVLLQMPFTHLKLGWKEPTTGRRHLRDRLRKFSQSKRPKRRDAGVRLYRKCLRMHSRFQRLGRQ